MSAPNTTPGPWFALDDCTSSGLEIRGGGYHYPLAKMCSYWMGPGPREAEAKANYHLIAAAPDMYDALERLTTLVKTCREAFPNDPVSAGKVCREALSFGDFERAFEVLRKARGEA